jgi:hypothetical protein
MKLPSSAVDASAVVIASSRFPIPASMAVCRPLRAHTPTIRGQPNET